MIGARRPSVTTALGQLIARREIERRADGEWMLLGQPLEARDPALAGAVRLERI
jgi:CRP/FNR family cyclic AMP-dependent transcriptional regulator